MLASRPAAVFGGLLLWGIVIAAVVVGLRRSGAVEPAGDAGRPVPSVPDQLVDYFATPAETLALRVPARVLLRKGDPIFTLDDQGRWMQAGYLTRTGYAEGATHGVATWYADEVDPATCQFAYYRNRGSLGEVVQTLLPPAKRERIEQMIREAVELNAEDIAAAVRPIVTRSLAESVPVVEEALKESIAAHRDELDALGAKYREVILDERLLPLVREEVLPSLRKHAEPVAQEIGRELWNRASLWRFGWRALYDKAPLPERNLFKDEWDRFVAEEAIPVIESHMDDVIEAQQRVLVDIARNPRVRQEVRDVVEQLAADRQLQRLLSTIVRESILENRELRQVWADNWQRADARAALQLTGERLDPVVRQIGDELFGTRETGISPEFARVLRNQILGKDRRWIVATPDDTVRRSGGVIPVRIATDNAPFPLLILASPLDDERLRNP